MLTQSVRAMHCCVKPRGVANSLRLQIDPLHTSLFKIEKAKASSLFSSIAKSKTNQFSVELSFLS